MEAVLHDWDTEPPLALLRRPGSGTGFLQAPLLPIFYVSSRRYRYLVFPLSILIFGYTSRCLSRFRAVDDCDDDMEQFVFSILASSFSPRLISSPHLLTSPLLTESSYYAVSPRAEPVLPRKHDTFRT